MCSVKDNARFSSLGSPRRVWAIGSVHGEVERLVTLHDQLIDCISPGDRIVYLGNYIGYGPAARETVDEILTYRRLVLSIPGMKADDLIYLRGGQEEMWQKLMQLQFAPDPANVLLWMLGNGMAKTLESYGINPHDGIIAAQEGVMSLTRWTASIRQTLKKFPGHDVFSTHLRRAAFTNEDCNAPLLFVHAGLDPKKSLDQQGDNFWWSSVDFNGIHDAYNPYHKVIRGYDPRHSGLHLNCVTATIDGGCGFGGGLVCAGFDQSAEVTHMIEA